MLIIFRIFIICKCRFRILVVRSYLNLISCLLFIIVFYPLCFFLLNGLKAQISAQLKAYSKSNLSFFVIWRPITMAQLSQSDQKAKSTAVAQAQWRMALLLFSHFSCRRPTCSFKPFAPHVASHAQFGFPMQPSSPFTQVASSFSCSSRSHLDCMLFFFVDRTRCPCSRLSSAPPTATSPHATQLAFLLLH